MISQSNSQNFIINLYNQSSGYFSNNLENIHSQLINPTINNNSYFLPNVHYNSSKTDLKSNPKKKFYKRARFSPEEDKLLIETVYKIGTNDWNKVSKELYRMSQNSYQRSPKQCKDRYVNYLSPDIKNKEWTLEEDQCLIYYFMLNAYHWSSIKKFLPGRSEISIKNRFNKLKKEGLSILRPIISTTSQNPKYNLALSKNSNISNLHKNLDQFNSSKENSIKSAVMDATKVYYSFTKKNKDLSNTNKDDTKDQDENIFSQQNDLDEFMKLNSDNDLFDFQDSFDLYDE